MENGHVLDNPMFDSPMFYGPMFYGPIARWRELRNLLAPKSFFGRKSEQHHKNNVDQLSYRKSLQKKDI
ncbi:hypothetical protein GCM10007877_20110 [Marinibactrum halimedae]|uniref:Uncharacterized protein n=1 Tax=Marinibactrum halimedae TaxID=1444977 RepID=A0AA37T5V9_9GAMM|nr:hypothetical protein GCM10007877_20110 [Marinibactrum halimedae]